MQSQDEMRHRLAELRRSFDESFAVPVRSHETEGQVLLGVTAGGMKLAVRLGELAGIHLCRKIVPLPDSAGVLLGLAGLRSRLFAVYDLASLLGSESMQADHRWVLLAAVDPHIAFAVETLETYIEVAQSDLFPVREGDTRHESIQQIALHQGVMRAVVNIPQVVQAALRRTEKLPGARG